MKTEETKSDARVNKDAAGGQEQEWNDQRVRRLLESQGIVALSNEIRASIAKVREDEARFWQGELAKYESFVPLDDQIAIAVKPYVELLKEARNIIQNRIAGLAPRGIRQGCLDKIDAMLAN